MSHRNPLLRAPRTLDVAVPAGVVTGWVLVHAAIQFVQSAGWGRLDPPPMTAFTGAALALHALASALTRDIVPVAIVLAVALRNAGLAGRRALRVGAIGVAALIALLGWVAPLALRLHVPDRSDVGTWTLHQLAWTAAMGEGRRGPASDIERFNAMQLLVGASVVVLAGLAVLALVVPTRRVRVPAWLVPALVALQGAVTFLVRLIPLPDSAPAWLRVVELNGVRVVGLVAACALVRALDVRFGGSAAPAPRLAWRRVLAVAAAVTIAATLAFGAASAARMPGGARALVARIERDAPAPDFVLESIDGERVTLVSLRGSVVVVTNWASWCGPCRRELPLLDELAGVHRGAGLRVLAVNRFEEDSVARAHLEESGSSLTAWRCTDAFAADYPGNALPTTFVIDREGILRHAHEGFGPGMAERLRDEVEALVGR